MENHVYAKVRRTVVVHGLISKAFNRNYRPIRKGFTPTTLAPATLAPTPSPRQSYQETAMKSLKRPLIISLVLIRAHLLNVLLNGFAGG